MVFPVRRDGTAGQFVVVALQSSQRQPGLGCPQFGRVVVAGGDQEVAVCLLELDVGHEVGVGGDGVLDVPLPEVPDLAAVVLTGGDDVITIRRPVSPCDALEMSLHDALARPQVQHSPEAVQPAPSCWKLRQ